jgi:nucleoside-diphosphate-sugar epimerase
MSELAVVCGAGGFIGGHLVRSLLDLGYRVRAVDLKCFCDWWQIDARADNWPNVDLRYRQDCGHSVSGCDHVFNLAADMGGMGFIETHKAECMLSVLINTHLLMAARDFGVSRCFYASSACVYAADKQRDPNVTGLKEDDAYPAMPEDGYGWEKLFSERMCRHFREDYGLQTRVARFHNVYGPCFDSETEVLTDSGWKKFENLLRTDLIASRNSNGFMEFVEIAEFQERQHKGDMYLCCHSAMDQCVTEDHAIFSTWSTTRGTNERYVPPFQRHIVGGTKWNRARMYFTSKADWEGKRLPSHLDLPSCKMSDGRSLHSPRSIKMEDWFDFVGWYLTEGSSWATPRNFTVSIVQNPGKKAQHIVSLIKRMGFKPYINGRNIITSNKQLYEAVQNCNHGAANKRIPRWMLGSSKKLLHTLFRSMMEGDGNATGNRYSTVSKGLADDFSELCLKLGFHAWVGHEQGKGNGIYRVHISRRRQLCTKAHHRSIIQYDGKVYDVTLVRNHVMMVRRNGKPVWSGNCGSWTGGREKAPAAICRKVAEAKLSGRDYIEIWGDGTKTRSFMWIDDCIRGILMLTDSDIVEPLNIGSSEKVSINQLVDVVESIAGVKLERRYQLDKPQGVNGRNSDNTKIKALLNWEPSTPLRVGLEKTYSWIEEQVRKEMGK